MRTWNQTEFHANEHHIHGTPRAITGPRAHEDHPMCLLWADAACAASTLPVAEDLPWASETCSYLLKTQQFVDLSAYGDPEVEDLSVSRIRESACPTAHQPTI